MEAAAMREFSISQFKAHALSILKAVDETGESVLVTKRGRPVARVVPFKDETPAVRAGHLSKSVLREGDILSPIGAEDWEAAREGVRP
jgi:prevent-host-death family protein